jgi:hypothetical protein
LKVKPFGENSVMACDRISGACLVLSSLDLHQPAKLEAQFTSPHYGSKLESLSACWTTRTTVPCKFRWAIIPGCDGDDWNERLSVLQRRE